ncbi:MAG: hypothetical protein RL134_2525 [Actinomycetota bacterium]|jgi:hypothetical protein
MTDFKRDRYGRPLVVVGDDTVAYKRPSSYGNVLEDKFALNAWSQRMALIGAAKRPDLLAQIASTAQTDEKGTTAALNELVENCIEASGGNEGRRLGDALHKYIHLVNQGRDVQVIAPWDKDVEAYRRLLDEYNLEPIPELCEVNLVNDAFMAAGSADEFLRDRTTGRIYLADVKTGKRINSWNAYLIQMTLYANSQLYNTETDERRPLPDELRTDVGLLIHIPAGTGTGEIIGLDLIEGLRRTEIAQNIHGLMKDTSFRSVLPKPSSTTAAPSAAEPPPVVVEDTPRPRYQHLADRLQAIVAVPNGKKVLAEAWIAAGIGFPPKELAEKVDQASHPSANDELTAQMEAVQRVIEHGEKLLSMPFLDPPQPPAAAPKTKERTTQPRTLDEGGDADPAAIKALEKHVRALPDSMQQGIKQIAADANKAKGSISLRQRRTVRRFELGRALVAIANILGPDDDLGTYMAALIQHVWPDHTHISVGAAIATLDAEAASALAHAADQLAEGQLTLRFDDNGRPVIGRD